QLSRELLSGALRSASAEAKADALARCSRVLLAGDETREEAIRLLDAARRSYRTESVSIAEAHVGSYNNHPSAALKKLSLLDSAEARAVSFVVIRNANDGRDPLTCLSAAGLSAEKFSSDGKFFVLKQLLDASRWEDSLSLVNSLEPTDY